LVSVVNTLIGIGFALVVIGIFWMVMNAEMVDIKEDYYESTPHLDLMGIGVDVFPTVMFLVGIICSLSGIGIKVGRPT
jgi:hypothetical protein